MNQNNTKEWINRSLRILLVCLAAYLVVAGIAFVSQRYLIYPRYLRGPETHKTAPKSVQVLWLTVDEDTKVEGWFVPTSGASEKNPAPLVVFTHGNAELIDDWPLRLSWYTDHGFNLLLPEYRGYGRSTGSPAQEPIISDAHKLIQKAGERPEVDATRIILHGRSLGGGIACGLAAIRSPQALILQSTFARLADMAWNYLMPPFLVLDEYDNQAVVAQYERPILIMHGTEDNLIPFSHAQRLRDAAKEGQLIARACDHNNCLENATYWQTIETYLRQQKLL